ncbi:hypothetical protein C6N75_29900, partial [Streptomyces solincola]
MAPRLGSRCAVLLAALALAGFGAGPDRVAQARESGPAAARSSGPATAARPDIRPGNSRGEDGDGGRTDAGSAPHGHPSGGGRPGPDGSAPWSGRDWPGGAAGPWPGWAQTGAGGRPPGRPAAEPDAPG